MSIVELVKSRFAGAGNRTAEDAQSIEENLIAVGYPAALAKACLDDGFSYALGLTTGEVITFGGAKDLGHGWVHINDITGLSVKEPQMRFSNGPFSFERGVDVRLSQIAWVADAPWGS